ncbi:hypothetical protein G9A89_010772 [Geosiphon pyriformis]|nr:hypothetical protein G9A89_010772 [Geosiphon pyriformis]
MTSIKDIKRKLEYVKTQYGRYMEKLKKKEEFETEEVQGQKQKKLIGDADAKITKYVDGNNSDRKGTVIYTTTCNIFFTGVISKTTMKVNSNPPTNILFWDNFFEEVNQFCFDQQLRFKKLQFVKDREITNKENVCDALNSNICTVVNRLMLSEDYKFTKLQTHTPGISDFNCFLEKLLILVIEVKRKHVLEDIGGRTFFEFYQDNDKTKIVVQQIYNYIRANEYRYGIVITYNNHWFLYQEHTKLLISKTLSLQSKSLPVLKAYAYLA